MIGLLVTSYVTGPRSYPPNLYFIFFPQHQFRWDNFSDEEGGVSDEEDGVSDEEDGVSDEEENVLDEDDNTSDEEDNVSDEKVCSVFER